ncbi:CarboxypepD_reg-like domain-containing protein [Algoriphagus faecimaris]|uniref:CarboxypepD_reg-like domain-containing protein n=1 Tax=Algoriphagus faecimaris TaxID=686796 RepID=A0A1G6MRC3_9BACT|nr:carboxypeptidase-like regulatory domain-containing protein [Algoriphagus faecimaris]SDC58138.1 CarboxypepD_reg-like domain-containing protein [Algoriphagus faecimaris]
MKTKLKLPGYKNLLLLFSLVLFIAYHPAQAIEKAKSDPSEDLNDPKVSAQVIDETGKVMQGIAVLVKGSTTGTVTDKNGFFELNLSGFNERKVTLLLMFPDYQSKEVVVTLKKLPKDMGQIKMEKE